MAQLVTRVLAALILSAGLATAADRIWQDGLHFHEISPPPPPHEGGPVEVAEFFWYGCPHCYQFEPSIKKWLDTQPAGIAFTRIPVLFGGAADLHARAYYALEVMGELERLHEPFFKALHTDKKKLRTESELEDWLLTQEVDVDKFRAAMTSFAVSAKFNRAGALMRRYGVRSVPALVVGGRYRTGSGFDGYGDMIEVTTYLADKVRNAGAPAATKAVAQ